MIEEPPLLTIRADFPRPSDKLLSAFADTPASMVSDAMNGAGALNAGIAPLPCNPVYTVVGPALPVENGPGDLLALLAATKFAQPGDVVVSCFAGHQGCAALGDRLSGMMKNAGATAIVTDGPARDLTGIAQVGLPIWCTGLVPNTPFSNGPGAIGLAVQIGGQRVGPGDIIVADSDGVVVVPLDQAEVVAGKLAEVRKMESDLDAEVANGLIVPENIESLLASDRVRYVD